MIIDWDKAPEGATHHYAVGQFPWRDLSGEHWKWFSDGEWKTMLPIAGVDTSSAAFLRGGGDLLTPRPEPWDGTGLPPVGTVCEWAGCTFASEDPTEPDLHVGDQVTIIAHFKDGEFDLAAFTFNPQIHNPDRGTAWVNQGAHGCFRPIRTPEQVAEQERQKSINLMMVDAGVDDKEWSREFCAALYDAGYRKTCEVCAEKWEAAQ